MRINMCKNPFNLQIIYIYKSQRFAANVTYSGLFLGLWKNTEVIDYIQKRTSRITRS